MPAAGASFAGESGHEGTLLMTDKENNARQAELNVKEGQAELRRARLALEIGTRKAKAVYEEEVNKLTDEVTCAAVDLERQVAWLAKAKSDLEKPFTNSQAD